VLKQAIFPVLQANADDDGSYGFSEVPVLPFVEKTIGPEGIKVAILGIGNHRVPKYELPSNIPGLTFNDPIAKAQELSDALRPTNDVVIALTHIGFTDYPSSVEIDTNVDTYMAATVTGLDAIIGGHSHTNPATGFGDYKYLPAIVGDTNNTPVIINHTYRYNNTLGEVIIGVRAKGDGGYEVVSRSGRYFTVSMSTPEDPAIKTIVDPYAVLLNAYKNTIVGETTVPIDTLQAYTQETNGANLQADASVYELAKNGISVDFHLSGAMTNRRIAPAATSASPVILKVSDMFQLMPYENSLVVMEMNGPQLKAVLERAYRNYYYYKYVPGYGGYSYYTTCMLDIDAIGKITYYDNPPEAYDPNQSYVISLQLNGDEVDFNDASKYYKVSTVNYLAAGSCNFNDGGVSLWPLNQIVNDTQYYVRDAVINYVTAMGKVSPSIEGRLRFTTDNDSPVITVITPQPDLAYQDGVTFQAQVADQSVVSEVLFYVREPDGGYGIPIGLEGLPATLGLGIWQNSFNTLLLPDGDYVFLAEATDIYGNQGWSNVIPFSIRNMVFQLLPSTTENKAGRTLPIKFSLRVPITTDPSQPFINNTNLQIKVYKCTNAYCTTKSLKQTFTYGPGAANYRINVADELYIANYKTASTPSWYLVEIWRPNGGYHKIGSFTFNTSK
jgi:2',3'-cyclic-nucleotide 2'-phosphodiesterase (5'-nucleotidase family)